MVKTLRPIGNSLGLIIDKPILDLLKITAETSLEITTDGDSITIRPLRAGHRARIRAASRAVIREHERTLRRLAE